MDLQLYDEALHFRKSSSKYVDDNSNLLHEAMDLDHWTQQIWNKHLWAKVKQIEHILDQLSTENKIKKIFWQIVKDMKKYVLSCINLVLGASLCLWNSQTLFMVFRPKYELFSRPGK